MATQLGVPASILLPTLRGLAQAGLLQLGTESTESTTHCATGSDGLVFLMLRITERCNLRCTYCYEDAGESGHTQDLSQDDAEAALTFFAGRCRPRATVLINGGEALLRMEFLEHCARVLAEQSALHGKNIRLAIQTNGTVASPRALRFLRAFGVTVGVSFDGFGFHDVRRPFRNGRGSAAIVWKNIGRMVEQGIRVSLMVTVTSDNVSHLPEICESLQAAGIERVKFSALSCQGRAAGAGRSDDLRATDYTAALNAIFDLIESGRIERLRVEQAINLMNLVMVRRRLYLCERRPCGAAREFLAAMPDGRYYPCDVFPMGQDFALGAIGSDVAPIDASPIGRALAGRAAASGACATCDLRALCSGGCPGNAVAAGAGVGGIEPFVCEGAKTLLPDLMLRLWRGNERLLSYHREHAHLPIKTAGVS